MLSLSSKAGK